MNENPKYTIDIQPTGDHLQVTIPEIGVTVETASGEVSLEDAERVALTAKEIPHQHTQVSRRYTSVFPWAVFLLASLYLLLI